MLLCAREVFAFFTSNGYFYLSTSSTPSSVRAGSSSCWQRDKKLETQGISFTIISSRHSFVDYQDPCHPAMCSIMSFNEITHKYSQRTRPTGTNKEPSAQSLSNPLLYLRVDTPVVAVFPPSHHVRTRMFYPKYYKLHPPPSSRHWRESAILNIFIHSYSSL